MKTEFLKPRFQGARFEEHTLPIEVARDLAAYESLVIELAKHLFLQDYPDRQRVPKGFGAEFHLHLERVDEGSVRPVLSLITAAALFAVPQNDYFKQARDLVSECIAAPVNQLPAKFPRELLSHFNQVGRSLKSDESIEFPAAGANPAVLTPERRKNLVLAADQVYEREVELSGSIGEADWEKSTFRLRMPDGSQAVIPMPASFHAQARKYGGQNRHQVIVYGVGAFDSWDRLQKVIASESIDIQPDYQLAARLDDLLTLQDGWYNGNGIAPDRDVLGFIRNRMIGHYPEKVPIPAIVPTPEGNLLFEWDAEGEPSLDLKLQNKTGDFHAFRPNRQELEAQFDLSEERNWQNLYSFLAANIIPRLT